MGMPEKKKKIGENFFNQLQQKHILRPECMWCANTTASTYIFNSDSMCIFQFRSFHFEFLSSLSCRTESFGEAKSQFFFFSLRYLSSLWLYAHNSESCRGILNHISNPLPFCGCKGTVAFWCRHYWDCTATQKQPRLLAGKDVAQMKTLLSTFGLNRTEWNNKGLFVARKAWPKWLWKYLHNYSRLCSNTNNSISTWHLNMTSVGTIRSNRHVNV